MISLIIISGIISTYVECAVWIKIKRTINEFMNTDWFGWRDR